MENFWLRVFWWVNYVFKFVDLLLIVAFICITIECLLEKGGKKRYFLYAAAEIAAVIFGVRRGIRTFHDIEFSPFYIIFYVLGCCLGIFIIVSLWTKGSKAEKEENAADEILDAGSEETVIGNENFSPDNEISVTDLENLNIIDRDVEED